MANGTDRASQIFKQAAFGTGNQAGSVVDFLKSRGLQPAQGEKFPLFGQRAQLFGQLGLNQQLGEFRGSAEQNTALLNQLQRAERDSGVSINQENIGQVVSSFLLGGTPSLDIARGVTPESETIQGILKNGQQDILRGEAPSFASTVQLEGRGTPSPVQAAGGLFDSTPPLNITGAPGSAAETPSSIAGQDPASLLPQIPSGDDIASKALEAVTGSATFPLQLEAQEAQKAALQVQAEREKEGFIKNIASRGLFFSGAKTKGLNTIEADKLSKILGVDRKFALLIAQGLEKSAQEIAKEAQAGRKEAIDSLQALGFAINPLTGRIEPTLSARRQAGEAERADTRVALDIAAEERLRTGQALSAQEFAIKEERIRAQNEWQRARDEEQAMISRARLELDILKEQRLASQVGELTPAQIQKQKEELANVVTFFNTQPDRETALRVWDEQKDGIDIRLGPGTADGVLALIDERFPAPPPPAARGAAASPTAEAAGRAVGSGLGAAGGFVGKPFAEVGKDVSSFLRGLGL